MYFFFPVNPVTFTVFAALIVAQESPTTSSWPPDACTDKSFSIPSWIIDGFTIARSMNSSTTTAIGSFNVTNRVTNLSSNLVCPIIENECQINGTDQNASFHAKLQVGNETTRISLNQSWFCNDKKTLNNESYPLSYTASGATDITLSCDNNGTEEYCTGPKRLIRGSLLEPFRISPQYLVALGSASPDCMAPSSTLIWTIIGATYSNITSGNDWVGPSPGRWLNLDIENNAGNFSVKCRLLLDTSPYSAPAKFDENCWVDPYKSSQAPPQIGNIWTDFSFNESDYSISIKQTWFCEDLKSSESYNVTAVGNSVLPLKCGIEYENNDCTCSDLDVPGSVTSRDILPQFEIDPQPTTGGCTIESIYTPHYAMEEIRLYDLENSPADPRSATFRFWLHADHALGTNSELIIQNSINVSRVANSLSAQTWIDSNFVSNAYNTLKCRWRYDFAVDHFTLHHEWLCSDKDPNNPIYFRASASFDLPPRNCSTLQDKSLYCELPGYLPFSADVSPGQNWDTNSTVHELQL